MPLKLDEVERMIEAAGGKPLEEVLGVFEVFASGSLTDEIYILDDVGGKRIAIAPATFREKHRPPARAAS